MANLRRLTMELARFPNMEMLETEALNKRQCKNLLDNFHNGVQAIKKIHSDFQVDVFDQVKKNMLCVLKKSRGVVEDCCKENWCQVVMMQINNKEVFRELLWDFECSFHLMCDIFRHSLPSQEDEINTIQRSATFYPTSLDEVEEDQNLICDRLSKHMKLCKVVKCEDCTLAQYLLGRVRSLQRVEGGELDNIIFPYKYPYPEYETPPSPLGIGGFGNVYPTQWLGFNTVTKVIEVNNLEHENVVWKEASILGGLNHPNIIGFFCCGLRTKSDKFGLKKKIFELVMEQGEMNLSTFLKQQDLLVEGDALELMLQIARGICYLHDMKVAHRDLKPCNVVVTSKTISKAGNLKDVHVKLVDFGISKIEVKNSPDMPTNGSVCGTSGYMAPEAFERRSLKIDAFKTDVFSFGIVCSEILTAKKHFDKLSVCDYVRFLLKGDRPKLPETCSSGLKSLIHRCWCLDPVQRPTFLSICQILTKLKGEAIMNAIYDVGGLKLVKGFTSHVDLKTNQEQWSASLKIWKFLGVLWFLSILWRMFVNFNKWVSQILPKAWELTSVTSLPSDQEVSNTTISNPMPYEVNAKANGQLKFIGLDRKIFEMEKILQHESSVALIGMGGVGKSTLAKALSDHIFHKFNVTCFLGDFMDGRCTILVQHKSRAMNVHAQSITLKEGREILEQWQKTQEILIVLDNIGNSSQLDELLGPHIFEDVNGSRLIVTSRDWKSLDRHVPIVSRINMQTLNEDQSMELFSMHAFTTNQPCLPYLEHVFKKIVSTCNGLPLSLEVMGSNLHGEKRLRVWERTMHRLLRARHDGNMEERIWRTLRVSFDELNDKEKNMFLDIACFFCNDLSNDGIGFTKESLYKKYDDDINILQQTLESLQYKSLIKVNEFGILNMHDQLCGMGRMIAEMEYQGTRMWDLCSATFIGYHDQKGMEIVEGLSFATIEHNSKNKEDICLNAMNNLQFLNVHNCENVDLLFAIMSKTTQLKWLSISLPNYCDDFSLQQESLMQNIWDFAHDNLHQMCVLKICNSKICKSISLECLQELPLKQLTFYNCDIVEDFPHGLTSLHVLEELQIIKCKNFKNIPNGIHNLTSLTKVQISGCEALEEFPCGLSTLVALEELQAHECKFLKRIPGGFGGLTHLKELSMGDCEALEEFPSGISTLIALENLYFYQCKSLKLIREGFKDLTCLKKLIMWNCESLEVFPSGISMLVSLEKLHFQGCKSLKLIPEGFGGLTRLKVLSMGDCEALEEFPSGISTLKSLKNLYFYQCKSLKRIQEGFEGLTCLKRLIMWDCEALEIFPSRVSTLVSLEVLQFHGCKSLKLIPEGFGGLTCLKELSMGDCEALEEFPSGISTLVALENLYFYGCKSLKLIREEFDGLTCLKNLIMGHCEALEKYPSGVSMLVSLEALQFQGCKRLKLIPEGFGGLTRLKELSMWNCEALEEIPSGISTLIALQNLHFFRCKLLKLIPEGFGGLTCLRKLIMGDCEALEEFPSGISTLIALETLYLWGCISLKIIPEGFGGLIHLKELIMWDCEALEVFPSGVSTLVSLELLQFQGCKRLKFIPEGFGGLTCLKELSMEFCEALEEFPSGISTLVSLEKLRFQECKSLTLIPEGFGGLTCLKELSMENCEALEEFPSGISTLVSLEKLHFQGCKSLTLIPEGFWGLTRLTELSMGDCEALEEFPLGISTLTTLENLYFYRCKSLKLIPEGFGGLKYLKKLIMWDCEALEVCPSGISMLVSLEKLQCHGCKSLKVVPEGFGELTCLKELSMGDCEALREFPSPICNSVTLQTFYFRGCKSLMQGPVGCGILRR